jgi:uncharacterized lipoprotein YmbA
MTSTPLRVTACLGLLLLLAGCGSSPPSHFYRLTSGPGAISANQQPSLGVGPIAIPEFLNRSALVYSGGNNRLQVAGSELWAEPLNEGVQRVLGLNLAQQLDTGNLSYFPWDTRNSPEYGIRVNVLDLDADEQQATLVADWQLYRPATGATITRRISQYSESLAAGTLTPSELPRAYSALLYQLSETIAGVIRAEQENGTAGKTNTEEAQE